ncbi:BLMH [Symbiodinium sp. KB8]|nr:BLMH [Symbiodinium sp. KB8]
MSVLRLGVIDKYNLSSDFELSQSYVFFWDKVERANFFLNNIIETVAEDAESRLIQALLNSPLEDGGQWDMAVNIIKKYGVVPKDVFPEVEVARSSRVMNSVLVHFLREVRTVSVMHVLQHRNECRALVKTAGSM